MQGKVIYRPLIRAEGKGITSRARPCDDQQWLARVLSHSLDRYYVRYGRIVIRHVTLSGLSILFYADDGADENASIE